MFRLQGKLLNVRENSKDNGIIDNIMTSMGVQKNKIYEGEDYADSLRYGKVMIMTDQVSCLNFHNIFCFIAYRSYCTPFSRIRLYYYCLNVSV